MIASVGESLIDRVGGRETVEGRAFNTALAASRLGAAVTYYGKVSSDPYGRLILERMIDNGVLFDPMLCNAAEPTLCISDGKVLDYRNTTACTITEAELSESFAVNGDIDIVFFGAMSLLMEPGCKALMPAIDGIKTRPRYFFDIDVGSFLDPDPETYRNLVLSLAGGCDIVRANDKSVALLFPGLPLEEAERRLAGLCEWNLVVNRGNGDSTWFTKFFRVDRPAVKLDCDETFNGAVLEYLQRKGLIERLSDLDRESVEGILDHASRAGALNLTIEGCDPPCEDRL